MLTHAPSETLILRPDPAWRARPREAGRLAPAARSAAATAAR